MYNNYLPISWTLFRLKRSGNPDPKASISCKCLKSCCLQRLHWRHLLTHNRFWGAAAQVFKHKVATFVHWCCISLRKLTHFVIPWYGLTVTFSHLAWPFFARFVFSFHAKRPYEKHLKLKSEGARVRQLEEQIMDEIIIQIIMRRSNLEKKITA